MARSARSTRRATIAWRSTSSGDRTPSPSSRDAVTSDIDHAALAALRDEPSSWATKGLPLDKKTTSLAQLVAGRHRLDVAGFSFPIMTLTESALANNVEALAAFSRTRGVELAPHGKTTMAPQLFERQLDAG